VGELLGTHRCVPFDTPAAEPGNVADMIVDDLELDPDAFAAGTGWTIKPEGACRGEVCVPLGGATDLEGVAARLGMPIVSDGGSGLHAIGPASYAGRALSSVQAPDLELPTVLGDGVWRLAEQRGRRTVIVAWAPW
jgi:hypothetical protein